MPRVPWTPAIMHSALRPPLALPLPSLTCPTWPESAEGTSLPISKIPLPPVARRSASHVPRRFRTWPMEEKYRIPSTLVLATTPRSTRSRREELWVPTASSLVKSKIRRATAAAAPSLVTNGPPITIQRHSLPPICRIALLLPRRPHRRLLCRRLLCLPQ